MIFLKKIDVIFCIILSFSVGFEAKHFVLMSAPGSGKGTFSQYLVEKHGYVQICAGDLFRHEIIQQTELGKKIQSIVESGQYVDEDITCELMSRHLLVALSEKKQFILDGFPRSEHSLNYIKKFFIEQNLCDEVCFVQLQASDSLCAKRILSRIVCNTCFRVYNAQFLSTSSQVNCEKCGALLSTRLGDREDVVFKRLKHFHDIVEPLLEVVRSEYCVYQINAEQSISRLQGIYDELI